MILGIESSCDDSSIALIEPNSLKLKFHKKISQELSHSEFGGVVPELAARLHTSALPKLLEYIKTDFSQISAVAVANEPGLSVSLLGGVSMAKALSISLDIPIIGVNHLVGHIYSLFLQNEAIFPILILLVSGGHTLILDVKAHDEIEILASTSDDSFGESFDKVAKMMNLGYPGGQIIEKMASLGDSSRFKFTIPLKHDLRIEYSFSGLKNQVRLAIQRLVEDGNLQDKDIYDVSASFQKIACEHIIDKLEKIFLMRKFDRFGVVGGASANFYLRSLLETLCKKFKREILFSPMEFCSDNAAMIARAAVEKYRQNDFTSYKDLQIRPNLNLKK